MDAAMNSAVSGLLAESTALSTISNNLSNSGTTGYKSVDTQFTSLLTELSNGATFTSGGVAASSRQNVLAQGTITSTSVTTDMSISGNGMFAVSAGLSGGTTYYTRNGAFDTDSSGNLYLSGTNYYLQGWPTDTSGNVTAVNSDNLASLETVNVDKYNSSAVATTAYTLTANFPAAAQDELGSISYTATGGVTDDLSIAYVQTSSSTAGGTTTATYQVAVDAPQGATVSDGSGVGGTASQLMYSVTVVNGVVKQAVNMANGTLTTSATGTFPVAITASNATVAATIPGTTWGSFTSSVGSGFVKSTSMTVYDSLGVAETAAVDWTAAGNNSWIMTINSPTNAAGTTSTGSLIAGTTTTSSYSYLVSFNSDGTLDTVSPQKIYNSAGTLIGTSPTSSTGEAEIAATWNDGATASTVAINLGTQDKTDGLSQFSTTSSTSLSINVKSYSQNGVQYGSLTGVSINSSGDVIASYDNGQQVSIYKIPVVTFPNENGLTELSGGVYSQSMNSGNYTLHQAGQDGSGSIEGETLESSTVNTTVEFSNMITAQQAYSSASQVISTDKKMFDSLISVVQG
jgi:flagellar hook protein FlgE